MNRVARLSFLAALATLSAVALAPPAPSAPATNVAYNDVLGSLYLAASDGTGVKTLIDSGETLGVEALAIAPNGKGVLAPSNDDGTLELVPLTASRPAA